MSSFHSSVLVVGGGIAGITAAVESAELGREVFLVERSPSLGGRVSAMKKYFPKLCPPYCGLEINYRRIKDNPKVTVFTSASVDKIDGDNGDYTVTVTVKPRYVKDGVTDPVTPFADLAPSVPNPYHYGLDKRKAAQVPHDLAFPYEAAVDEAALADPAVRKTLEGKTEIDLGQSPRQTTLKVGSIIWATGWKPYDGNKLTHLGYPDYADVIANVEFERLAAKTGPTGGKLVRPSDGREIKRVGFIQCAGSRDVNHLNYCSSVCCMGTLKHTTYVREAYPDAEMWIFYIDIRAHRYEHFYRKVQEDDKIHFIKGKPGSVERDDASGDLVVVCEEVEKNRIARVPVDLVVLATGMQPATAEDKVPYDGVTYDDYGFLVADPNKPGILPAGCVKRPVDVASSVQDATGASLKALRG